MATPTVRGYKDIIQGLAFWKYSIVVQYRDVIFKFKNTGAGNNGAAKLTVYGIVPKIFEPVPDTLVGGPRPGMNETQLATQGRDSSNQASNTPAGISGPVSAYDSKEYMIYTEVRGISLEKWSARIPWIVGYTGPGGYNFIEGSPGIPSGYKLIAGLGYESENQVSGFRSDEKMCIFKSIDVETRTYQGSRVTFDMPSSTARAEIPLNPNKFLVTSISGLLSEYNEHPGINFYAVNPNADPQTRKVYGMVPVGIAGYRVSLELANGENVSRYFDIYWQPVQSLPTLSTQSD